MLGEGQQALGDGVAGRLVPGGQQQHDEAFELGIGQGQHAVGAEEGAHQVVARFPAAAVGQLAGVVDHGHHR
ncbi:hypothetical protein D3C83_90340 [compost metagenome]